VSRQEALGARRASPSTRRATGSISLRAPHRRCAARQAPRNHRSQEQSRAGAVAVNGEHPLLCRVRLGVVGHAIKTPQPDTLWTADRTAPGAGQAGAAHLGQRRGADLRARHRRKRINPFDVKQSVENKSDKPATLFPGALSCATASPRPKHLHPARGPYGVFNGSLKGSATPTSGWQAAKITTTGGWLGITDKYWMATLVPDQKVVDATIKSTGSGPI
jgi:YidC/Oxa1 family membrane protein insertase